MAQVFHHAPAGSTAASSLSASINFARTTACFSPNLEPPCCQPNGTAPTRRAAPDSRRARRARPRSATTPRRTAERGRAEHNEGIGVERSRRAGAQERVELGMTRTRPAHRPHADRQQGLARHQPYAAGEARERRGGHQYIPPVSPPIRHSSVEAGHATPTASSRTSPSTVDEPLSATVRSANSATVTTSRTARFGLCHRDRLERATAFASAASRPSRRVTFSASSIGY